MNRHVHGTNTPGRGGAGRKSLLCGAFALLCAFLCAGSPAQTMAFRPSDVKAVFLLNFVKFVEWPSAVFPDGEAPVIIGVLGDDAFGSVVEKTVAGETVKNRPVVVKRSRRLADLRQCHVLFISASENLRLPAILASLKGTGILTVGEHAEFTRLGGIIGLAIHDNKMCFEINAHAAGQESLKISANLLRVARAVNKQDR